MSSLTAPAVSCRPRARRPSGGRRPEATAWGRPDGRGAELAPVAAFPTVQAPRRRVRLTARGRLVLGVLLLVLAIGGPALMRAPAAATGSAAAGPVAERVTVRPGDTLWLIAARAVPDTDPRVTVARIMEMNGLESSAVRAGRALLVPTTG